MCGKVDPFCFQEEATWHLKFLEDSASSHERQTHLEVSALGLQPVVDKALRISGKTQHELSLGLQLVNGLNGFMDLKRKIVGINYTGLRISLIQKK